MADRMALSLPGIERPRSLRDRKRRFHLMVGALVFFALLAILVASFLIGFTKLGIWVVGGTLGIIVAAVITLQPEIGAYILIATVYMNLSTILEVNYGIPSANQFIVALILVGTVANRIVINRKPLRIDRTQRIILLYGGLLLLGALRAENAEISWEGLIDFVKDYAILFIIVQLSDHERTWKRMQWVLIVSALILAALSVYQVATGDYARNFIGLANAPLHEITAGDDRPRPTGPLDDPNFYAQSLLMVMPIALYRFFGERSPFLKYIAGVATLLITFAAIFTYSRGAFLSLIALGILVIWERRWNPYKAGFIILAILVFMLPVLPAGYIDRVERMFDVFTRDIPIQDERSLTGRLSEMTIAVQIFLDNPVFGVGPDNYETNYLEYSFRLGLDNRLQERNAHSLVLETAAELGLVGLVVFSSIFISALRQASAAKKRMLAIMREDLAGWMTGVQLGLVSYLITSLFLHGDYIRYLWLLIGILVSVSYVADRAEEHYRQAREAHRTARPGFFALKPAQGQIVK
ncbi:MAG: O-antigen ligase family protein [Anaerolineae bacterium]|nr:O-antigen ligase family protein [Anaerolineae bacterium]